MGGGGPKNAWPGAMIRQLQGRRDRTQGKDGFIVWRNEGIDSEEEGESLRGANRHGRRRGC